MPLQFQPGSQFDYAMSTDFLGAVLVRLRGWWSCVLFCTILHSTLLPPIIRNHIDPFTTAYASHATLTFLSLQEEVSGQPLGAFLQQALFEPLGMVDTSFEIAADSLGRFSKCYQGKSPGVYGPARDPIGADDACVPSPAAAAAAADASMCQRNRPAARAAHCGVQTAIVVRSGGIAGRRIGSQGTRRVCGLPAEQASSLPPTTTSASRSGLLRMEHW